MRAALAACPAEVPDERNYGLTQRKPIFAADGQYPNTPAIDWEHCAACAACAGLTGPDGQPLRDAARRRIELRVGAIVVATGFQPYTPRQGEFGYGELPEVITLPQLERLLAPDGPTGGQLQWGDRPIRSVAFIHCVGSRQLEGVHSAAARWADQRLLLAGVLHGHPASRQRHPRDVSRR